MCKKIEAEKIAKRGAKIGQEVSKRLKVRAQEVQKYLQKSPREGSGEGSKAILHKNAEMSANASICYE